nr:MAG TPA_asm: hypothetical protein [Caudoviricetes sp.]
MEENSIERIDKYGIDKREKRIWFSSELLENNSSNDK